MSDDNNKEDQVQPYWELVILRSHENEKEPPWKDPSIRWYVETMTTRSMWETYVWIDNEVLPAIGNEYKPFTADNMRCPSH